MVYILREVLLAAAEPFDIAFVPFDAHLIQSTKGACCDKLGKYAVLCSFNVLIVRIQAQVQVQRERS
jgi:hypothetical protein